MNQYRLVIERDDGTVIRQIDSASQFDLDQGEIIDPQPWGYDQSTQLRVHLVRHRFDEANGAMVMVTIAVVTEEPSGPSSPSLRFE